jgi:hypothetical protein
VFTVKCPFCEFRVNATFDNAVKIAVFTLFSTITDMVAVWPMVRVVGN